MSRRKPEKPSFLARLVVGFILLSIVAGGLGAAAIASQYGTWAGAPIVAAGESIDVVIPHGTNWSGVVSRLVDAGVVEERQFFDFWARRRGLPVRAKAGAYTFRGPMSVDELAEALAAGGSVDEVSVTFPEGYTMFHMADRLEEVGLANRDDFLAAATDTAALAEAGIAAKSFEGYLFPDTYRFRRATSPDQIVARLHARWLEVWSRLETAHDGAIETLAERGLRRHEIATLASIVERESAVPSERPLIARVFLNRLDKKMKLQTDPTCVYGPDTYREVPSPAHCRNPASEYSTYVIAGLPPGPIANPGEGSLFAVLQPSKDEASLELLYFVAKRDGTGAHHFSATLAEHQKAIDRYLKK